MEKQINEQLQDLITVYGVERCVAAARSLIEKYGTAAPNEAKVTIEAGATLIEAAQRMEKLQASKGKGIPAEFFRVLAPESLDYTLNALDDAVYSQREAGKAREAAHRDRADYVRRQPQLELDVKLTEAEAMERVEGTGKDAYAMVGGKRMYLTNEAARDAYQLLASEDQRRTLAKNQAEINAIDVDIVRARDKWDTAKEASDTIRAKANLQAALLNFLASRG